MAEPLEETRDDSDHLPAMQGGVAWWKAMVFFAVLIGINVVGALVSFGFGVIVTIPLTLLMGFLLARDLMPRHRFPRGRFPRGRQPTAPIG